VGYPGETDEEFQTLLDFMQEIRFDRVGAFKFSFESGTASEALGDPVPDKVKDERLDQLMSLQQNVSLQINKSFIGQTLDMLVEGYDNGLTIGRSYRDAPEIDGLVLAEGQAEVGQIVRVEISGAMTYDLSGTLMQK
jgi:ribosomal protein S12 methylthiotransferase